MSLAKAALSAGRRPVEEPMRVMCPVPCGEQLAGALEREAVVGHQLRRPDAAELRELLVERHPAEKIVGPCPDRLGGILVRSRSSSPSCPVTLLRTRTRTRTRARARTRDPYSVPVPVPVPVPRARTRVAFPRAHRDGNGHGYGYGIGNEARISFLLSGHLCLSVSFRGCNFRGIERGGFMASPELQMVIDLLRSAPPVPREAAWAEQRAALENLTTIMPPPADVRFTPVDAGGVPAEWVAGGGGARRPRGALPARRRLLHRVDQHAPAACRGRLARCRRARPA